MSPPLSVKKMLAYVSSQSYLDVNPHLSYTTFCLKFHFSKWGDSATSADKLIFISTTYAPGIKIKKATSVRLTISLMK
jgi:hypothetical protein